MAIGDPHSGALPAFTLHTGRKTPQRNPAILQRPMRDGLLGDDFVCFGVRLQLDPKPPNSILGAGYLITFAQFCI